jgi:hypothetical protein
MVRIILKNGLEIDIIYFYNDREYLVLKNLFFYFLYLLWVCKQSHISTYNQGNINRMLLVIITINHSDFLSVIYSMCFSRTRTKYSLSLISTGHYMIFISFGNSTRLPGKLNFLIGFNFKYPSS